MKKTINKDEVKRLYEGDCECFQKPLSAIEIGEILNHSRQTVSSIIKKFRFKRKCQYNNGIDRGV